MKKLISILAVLFLPACGTFSSNKTELLPTVVETKLVKVSPPKQLTEQCQPAISIDYSVTNDVLSSRLMWMAAWKQCASRMEALTNWLESSQ